MTTNEECKGVELTHSDGTDLERQPVPSDGDKQLDSIKSAGHIEPPDGGYGWVVVVAVFFVHVFVLGNLYSFGVFYPVYIKEFNENQAAVAWVGSIGAGLMCGLGIWTGKWADLFGNEKMVFLGGVFVGIGFLLASFSTELWHLYLTQGLLAGIGYSLAFISGVSVVGQWFSKRRGLAVGIAVAGSGLGQFAISQITGVLIRSGGWRYALRILALICCVGLILCSFVIRRLLPRVSHSTNQSSLHMFKDRNFALLFAGCLLNSLGMFMPYVHLPIYAEAHGISSSNAVFILSIVGISSAVGRIAVGWFADLFGKILMFQVCIFAGGASTLCWVACTTFNSIIAYGVVFGFFAGGVISLMPGVAAELFGIKKLGMVIGLLYSSTAVGNLLSAPIGGYLHDAFHGYTVAIIVNGCFLLSGMVLVFFLDLSVIAIKKNECNPSAEAEDLKSVRTAAGETEETMSDRHNKDTVTSSHGYTVVEASDVQDVDIIPEEFEMVI